MAVLDRITDLPELAVLGPRFVLKPVDGHSSRNVFAMQDGVNLIGGQAMTRADIIRQVGADSTTAFLVEELLQDWSGGTGLPMDFKFHCFGHDVVLLHVVERHSAIDSNLNRHWFLTPDFEPLGFPVLRRVGRFPGLPPKPPIYPELLDMARAIAGGLNAFVRVDLYATPRGPVFGELTPFPHGGTGFTPRANAFLGGFWRGQEGCGD